MSHDLCLYSRFEEFPLIGNPDAEDPGLGRHKVFSGNAENVVKWYTRHCLDIAAAILHDSWIMPLTYPVYGRHVACDLDAWTACQDSYYSTPEWADPDPVARHLAMVDAFLAFAPEAKFGAS